MDNDGRGWHGGEAMGGDHKSARLAPMGALLALASRDGREALFGDDWGPVTSVVAEALPPFGVPDVNTEVPLAGVPGSDVHVRCSRRHFHGGAGGNAGQFWGRHPALLGWASRELAEDEGLGVSYDVREPVRDVPAIYYRGRSVGGFFRALGMPEAAGSYERACARLPREWRCWYTGSFPNRPSNPVRLGVVVGRRTQDSYVANPRRLAADLAMAGVRGLDGPVLAAIAAQAAQPYAFDIELDVLPGGGVGDVVGINLTLDVAGAEAREAVTRGSLGRALALLQAAGLADERWRLLGEATYRLLVPSPYGGQRGLVACANRLVYVKLRLRRGRPLDAKAYFQTSWLPL